MPLVSNRYRRCASLFLGRFQLEEIFPKKRVGIRTRCPLPQCIYSVTSINSNEGPLIDAHYPVHLFQDAVAAVGQITSLDGTPTLKVVA